MDCNVVKDLIPLYIDECCSAESAKIVKEHMDFCPECKALYESMNAPAKIKPMVFKPVKLERINDWKASVLQSILLFVSFAIIIVGVALEASTPSGPDNGYWAVLLVIPATGFMLSLANWYFVRLYKNRKSFSNCSLSSTLGITACTYIWAGFHYGINVFDPFFFGIGIVLTAICCALAKILSNKYAKMLGKE